MKKRVLGKFLILALLVSTAVAAMLAELAVANPMLYSYLPPEPDTNPPLITIYSPIPNQTYNSQTITLNFSVTKPETWFKLIPAWDSANNQETLVGGKVITVNYEIDGVENHSIPVQNSQYLSEVNPNRVLNFSLDLALPEGRHNLSVSAECESYSSNIVQYYYPYGEPYNVPANTTFKATSEDINFTVAKPPEAEQPTITIPALGIAIAGGAIGYLLYYRRKINHKGQ